MNSRTTSRSPITLFSPRDRREGTFFARASRLKRKHGGFVLFALAAALCAAAGCRGRAEPAKPQQVQRLGSGALRPEPVTIVSFGLIPVGDIRLAVEAVEETFGFQAARSESESVPADCISRDGRVLGLALLDSMVDAMPLDSVRVLGLTELDLFHPGAGQCMGLSQVEGKSSVVSLHLPAEALSDDLTAGVSPDTARETYRSRAGKLVRRQLAMTFMERGFEGCRNAHCLLHGQEIAIIGLDRVPECFCTDCAGKLGIAVRGPMNTPITYYNLGLYFEYRNLDDRAVMAYERALLGDPRMPQALNNLGAVSIRAGRLNSAADYLRRAVESDPAYALARLNLARTLAGLSDAEGALEQYEKCIVADPAMTAALTEGANLLRGALGKPEKAEEWLQRHAESRGKNSLQNTIPGG